MTRAVAPAAGLMFSGHDVMILASRNVFQYAWDLALGTGQSTDLAGAGLLALTSRRPPTPARGGGTAHRRVPLTAASRAPAGERT
jgi:hypothetical protein